MNVKKILNKREKLSKEELMYLLDLDNREDVKELFKKAYFVKVKNVGKEVYFRGIIEFSNICTKNCNYCGIRKENKNVKRFTMEKREIIESAVFAHKNQYGSIVLQSGERSDNSFVNFVEEVLLEIKEKTKGELGITLSLGEQTRTTYKKWFLAGAHRYLLRIETSNKTLYANLHPKNHKYEKRIECLKILKEEGYQVGTGVMIGLPGQTVEDLADDIIFFEKNDIDMIGMGPFIPHKDTPLGVKLFTEEEKLRQLELALKMIAVTRIYLQDVNIASTTALQALKHDGREMGLTAGANIIMPNITDTKYRSYYQLYEDKPCLDENAKMCRFCLQRRIEGIGETIGYKKRGDSPHFMKRVEKSQNQQY
jgi:biotin synthase